MHLKALRENLAYREHQHNGVPTAEASHKLYIGHWQVGAICLDACLTCVPGVFNKIHRFYLLYFFGSLWSIKNYPCGVSLFNVSVSIVPS
jgi:hypothetical protein